MPSIPQVIKFPQYISAHEQYSILLQVQTIPDINKSLDLKQESTIDQKQPLGTPLV